MSATVPAKLIAQATGLTKSRVIQRAAKEWWGYQGVAVRGGIERRYHVGTLPVDIKDKVILHLANQDAASAERLAAGRAAAARAKLSGVMVDIAADAARQAGLAQFMELPEKAKRRAEARAALATMARRYVEASGYPERRGLECFATQYNAGQIVAPDWVREERPSVCANSLKNWDTKLYNEGLARLGGKHGRHRKGTGVIDSNPAMRELILGMMVEFPHASTHLIMRGIKARFAEDLHPSPRTLQRWVQDYKAKHEQLMTAITNPDQWRSRFKSAGGDADAQILRLNQRWETDSTKGDLLLSDGKRHVIVGMIDVYSRRMKLHVSRSSSAVAVAAVMRKSLLAWGVPEVLGSDNGSDFVSKHVVRVLTGLNIEQDLAPPFTPEHKPYIERSFGTFCRDLVELLPGFVGHSVAQRKDIEARRSFAQRIMKEGGEAVELRMTPTELQAFCDKWTDQVYGIEAHSGLGGKSPFEMAASWSQPVRRIADERALDVLLAAAPGGDGLRTVGKKGIKLDHGWFTAAELGGLEGTQVRVLLDEDDVGEIFVFTAAGAWICKAVCHERSGVANQAEMAAQRQQTQRRVISEGKAHLKLMAKSANTDSILDEILRERATASGKLAAFPVPTLVYTTPDLDEAGLAARAASAPVAAPVSEREAAAQQQLEAEMAAPNVVRVETRIDRFRRAMALQNRRANDEILPGHEAAWLKTYERLPEYRALSDMYADFGEDALQGE